MMALAPPPPLQIEATPLCPGFSRARARWAVMRQPEAPSGWPKLTAPPWIFTLEEEHICLMVMFL